MIDQSGQARRNASDVYESFFVPAVFGPWAEVLLGQANVRAGERVLDLGCGTGVVARIAANLVGASGGVTGLDFNPSMLAVARSIRVEHGSAEIGWVEGSADDLHFPDAWFDLVTAQQMLQFVPDRVAVIREVRRVLRPGGRLALAVWAGPEMHPIHRAMDEIIGRHVGQSTILAGMIFSDPDEVRAMIEGAGLHLRSLDFISKDAHFPESAGVARNFMLSASAGIPSFRQLDVADRDRLVDRISADMEDLARENTIGDEVIIPWHAYIAVAEKPL